MLTFFYNIHIILVNIKGVMLMYEDWMDKIPVVKDIDFNDFNGTTNFSSI